VPKIKSLLCAAVGIVSGQHRLEACTVDFGPGTMLKCVYIDIYMYVCMYRHIHTHTHVCVCLCVCVCV
jgi:hypothetical protein